MGHGGCVRIMMLGYYTEFDGVEFEDLTVEQVAHSGAEYSLRDGRNCRVRSKDG